ncbi:unnamed protein product [Symbiodinium sp. CCMP2456]|nr:unnamed protein product [Symbiodinium sp. CCMP2456]
MAWLSPEWTWQQDMPCNVQFTAVTGANDRRLQNNAGFMYVRGQTDGRYQRFISTVHDEGADMWIFTAATREKLMVRRVGGALMWCIHADHLPEEGLVRFTAVSCLSTRTMATTDFADRENISITDLQAAFKEQAVAQDIISRQQTVTLVSSVTGGVLSEILMFVWGPRTHGSLKPRKRVFKKTAASQIALAKHFESL